MEYRESTSRKIDIDKINELRESVGWADRSREKWEKTLTKSSFVYTVWDQDKLIGMGRMLEDGVMCMFYDVVVHKDYQGNGAGKMIINKLVTKAKSRGCSSIGLFIDEQNIDFLMPFYENLGFKLVKTGMEYKYV